MNPSHSQNAFFILLINPTVRFCILMVDLLCDPLLHITNSTACVCMRGWGTLHKNAIGKFTRIGTRIRAAGQCDFMQDNLTMNAFVFLYSLTANTQYPCWMNIFLAALLFSVKHSGVKTQS